MKKNLSLLLVLTFIFVLVACSSEKNTISESNNNITNESQEITNKENLENNEENKNPTNDITQNNNITPPTTNIEENKPTTNNQNNVENDKQNNNNSQSTNKPSTNNTNTNSGTTNKPNNENTKPNTTIINPNDKQGPELVSLSLDKTNVSVGDIINFTAVINDTSSIHCAQFQFKSGADWHNIYMKLVSGNTYKGQLEITDSFLNGTYSISYIYLEDYAGNTTNTTHSATFTITK